MRKSLGLYVHIPFCERKCTYCSFYSKVGSTLEKENYMKNLLKEIRMHASLIGGKYQVNSIYIGGGTPSSLPVGEIKKLLHTIYQSFTVTNNAEITIELNPETVTNEKMFEYAAAGVNRVSFGLQAVQQGILKLMGRIHTYEHFVKAIELAKNHGINNISVDIILGYPSQTVQHVQETVEKVVAAGVTHVSAYMLTVEEGTPLKKLVDGSLLAVPEEKTTIAMYLQTVKQLKSYGYERYEVSNFAKVGYKSVHNQNYWNRGDYLGVGVAAHSFMDHVRIANHDNLSTYNNTMENQEENILPVAITDPVTIDEADEEMIMLSIRMASGLDTKKYEQQFGKNFFEEKKSKLNELVGLGLLIIDGDHIKATDKGFLVLNRVILELTTN